MDKQYIYDSTRYYHKIKELFGDKKHEDVIRYAEKYEKLFNRDRNNFKTKITFMKAKSLRCLNRFDEAINELNKILKMEYNIYALLELYFILYFTNRYEEALKILPTLYNDDSKKYHNFSLAITEAVMKKQLGIEFNYRKGTNAEYLYQQIFNYNDEKTINHIQSHKYIDELNNQENSKFNDIDLKYLMDCIKLSIHKSEKANLNDVLEIHYFGVSNIGYDNNSVCNYVKVIVCPNTTNIITMYPVYEIDSHNKPIHLEYDYDRLFKKSEKQKTLSRIDKFNKRYNLN